MPEYPWFDGASTFLSVFLHIETDKKSISKWRFGDALHIENFDRGKGEIKPLP